MNKHQEATQETIDAIGSYLEIPSIPTLIEETHGLLAFGRKIALKVAENVWRIREANFSGENQHQDFVKFCFDEFRLKSSQVSKYERIGDGFYAHGLTAESFKVGNDYKDYEVVYYASDLPLSLEEKLSTALTLSRPETKLTRAELKPHTPDYKMVCVVDDCWISEENHPKYDGQPF